KEEIKKRISCDSTIFTIMRAIGTHNYFVYILTNRHRNVLYVGITNDLQARLYQHNNPDDHNNSFTAKYNVCYLVYWERHEFIDHAIEREKQIKKWNRKKKEDLIAGINPSWEFLNDEVEEW